MKNNLKKDFFWNTIGVFLNASTSFFFLIAATRINGTDTAGIFTFAFTLTLLIQIIGYYAGRVFQVTETNKKITDSDYIYNHLITSVIMIIVGLTYSLFMKYSKLKLYLIITLLIYRSIESFVDSFYAIIQKNNYLYKVGISFFLKGLFAMISFLTIDILTNNILYSAISIIIVYLLIVFLYDIPNLKLLKFKLCKFRVDNIIYIFKTGFFVFLFTILNQYVINSPKYAIDLLLTNSDQTTYGIISMPATVMLLLSQFLIHPFLTILKNDLKTNKIQNFKNRVNKILGILICFGLVALIVSYFVGIPILELVYGVKLKLFNISLLKIILGSAIFGLTFILSNALITMRIDKEQTVLYIVQCVISYLVCNYFISKYSIYGAFDSYLVSMIILFIMYLILYIYKINKKLVK